MDYLTKLKEELSNTPSDYIVFLETTSDKFLEVSIAAIKLLLSRNDNGIIVSANRPYKNLIDFYKKNDIDVSKMFILDCISKDQFDRYNGGNVVFLENAAALTDISLHLDERIKIINGSKFLFIDSITTMLIHNDPHIFARFIHNVLTKMRLYGTGGLIISLEEKTNREVKAEIAQLCDKVIKID
jgi:archaellum biogenesis ATPase FlaH